MPEPTKDYRENGEDTYLASEIDPLLEALREWEKAWDMGELCFHYSSDWEPPKARLTNEA